MVREEMQREAAARASLFTVEKGVLRANADMYWEFLDEFDRACQRLLETRGGRLEVDLSQVYFISSSFLGCLSSLVIKASRLKKRVILKVSLDVSWLFEIMGGQKNVELEIW